MQIMPKSDRKALFERRPLRDAEVRNGQKTIRAGCSRKKRKKAAGRIWPANGNETAGKDKPGVTGDLLMQKLEMRLDNVIFRAGFAPSRQSARQLVGHSQFLINGKKINIPSREVKIGDVISAKPNKTKGEYFKQLAARLKEKKGGTPPSGWLETVPNEIVVKIKSKPTRNDLDLHVDAQVIVEFYSR